MNLATLGEIEAQIRRAVERWSPGARIRSVAPLTPDASLRRYFRVALDAPAANGATSVAAMWFDSVACPEAAGGTKVDSDEAYVELSTFLAANGVGVPELYLDARREKLILLEDLGDAQLSSLLLAGGPPEQLRPFLRAAIDQLVRIQSIAKKPGFFPFERSFTAELYVREMSEFEDFLFFKKNPPAESKTLLRGVIEDLAAKLDRLPKVLVHRDFHAWNLIVDKANRVRVIDFQDALLATRPYDIVSLLNDRDMDALLGRSLYCECVEYFVTQGKFSREILAEYDLVLLQRDLKVAGRFAKLNEVRGLVHYAAWIPGTLGRIGRTLERLASTDQKNYAPVLRMLETYFPEIAAGAGDPLRWGS